jgi:hypothetical protein
MPKKISQLTAKGSKIEATDLLEISQFTGGIYVSKSVTGSNLMEVSLDTSPQLGGDLDINGNKIISTSNGNISIQPNGTGAILIGGNSTQATELRFLEDSDNGSNYVALRSSNTLASNTTYTLPTADGSSGQVLSTNGSGTLSWATAGGGGLTVGTTAISSGTVGRILFEGTGNVLQEDAAFFWDNTNKRLGIGATPSTSVRLDVRAQGALSTDIAFRVRNSADSVTLQQFNGDGSWLHRNNANTFYEYFDGTSRIEYRRVGSVELGTNNDVTQFRFVCNTGDLFIRGGTNLLSIVNNNNFHFEESTGLLPTSGAGCIVMKNRTAPSTNVADRHYYYSDDIVAGNAAPHFRTENGNIVKIYQETTGVASSVLVPGGGPGTDFIMSNSTFDGYTLQQVVKALRNLGILA